MDKMKLIEQTVVHDNIPKFTAGDTVNIHYRRTVEVEKRKPGKLIDSSALHLG